MPTVLTKYQEEARTYSFDFSQVPEIVNGDTIASVISVTASPDGLTITAHSISGTKVLVSIQDGVPTTVYDVVCLIQTSSSAIVEGLGELVIA
jgi:hypothetical protein